MANTCSTTNSANLAALVAQHHLLLEASLGQALRILFLQAHMDALDLLLMCCWLC